MCLFLSEIKFYKTANHIYIQLSWQHEITKENVIETSCITDRPNKYGRSCH